MTLLGKSRKEDQKPTAGCQSWMTVRALEANRSGSVDYSGILLSFGWRWSIDLVISPYFFIYSGRYLLLQKAKKINFANSMSGLSVVPVVITCRM